MAAKTPKAIRDEITAYFEDRSKEPRRCEMQVNGVSYVFDGVSKFHSAAGQTIKGEVRGGILTFDAEEMAAHHHPPITFKVVVEGAQGASMVKSKQELNDFGKTPFMLEAEKF